MRVGVGATVGVAVPLVGTGVAVDVASAAGALPGAVVLPSGVCVTRRGTTTGVAEVGSRYMRAK